MNKKRSLFGKSLEKGEGLFQGIVVLAVLLIIIFTLPESGENPPAFYDGERYEEERYERRSDETSSQVRTARESRSISIGSGNAGHAYQPYEEYITIENRGDAAIDITGWQLRNGKDKRAYNLGGSLQRFSADIAAIPQGTKLIPASGTGALQNIVLEPRERAIVTTGRQGVESPYRITSFKENICTGYIGSDPDYTFVPALSKNCPRPSDEPGLEAMSRECRDFVKTLRSCEIPDLSERDSDGERCNNCVNGREVSSSCKAFIREHFTYQGCLAYHGSDDDFEGNTWRIYLNRGWEMWAEDYESIELFNSYGQLVDFRNY